MTKNDRITASIRFGHLPPEQRDIINTFLNNQHNKQASLVSMLYHMSRLFKDVDINDFRIQHLLHESHDFETLATSVPAPTPAKPTPAKPTPVEVIPTEVNEPVVEPVEETFTAETEVKDIPNNPAPTAPTSPLTTESFGQMFANSK